MVMTQGIDMKIIGEIREKSNRNSKKASQSECLLHSRCPCLVEGVSGGVLELLPLCFDITFTSAHLACDDFPSIFGGGIVFQVSESGFPPPSKCVG